MDYRTENLRLHVSIESASLTVVRYLFAFNDILGVFQLSQKVEVFQSLHYQFRVVGINQQGIHKAPTNNWLFDQK